MKLKHATILVACCALLAEGGCKQNAADGTGSVQVDIADQPEMVSIGICAKFKVPARQAAVFEVVTRRGGATVALPSLAAESGEIILAPQAALHPLTADGRGMCVAGQVKSAVAAELVRWFPAQMEPFTLRWLAAEEIVRLLRDAKIAS